MAPQITVLEHAFHLSLPVIPNKTTNIFSELTFDGEGNTSAVDHISKFLYECLRHKIVDPNVTCRLFSLTFRYQVKCWFESFPSNSIHSLSEFVIEFLSEFNNYDYDELSDELSYLRKENGESFDDFAIRFIHVCTRFPLKEMSLINEWFKYLIYLSDEPDQLIFNQSESSTNTQSQDGSDFDVDLEDFEAPQFLSTSFILENHEQHHPLQNAIVTSNHSLQTISPPLKEGTLTLKDDSCHTLIDFITISKVKEVECEVDNHVDDKSTPNLVEQIHDQSIGDKIISHTINQPSISSDLPSIFPLHNEPNCLLKTVSYYLKENAKEDDQFIQGEGTKLDFKTHIPIISRDAFHLLNSSTYYSLYPDIFYPNVVRLHVPYYLGENSTLYNQVQRDHRIEDKEGNNYAHEHINFYSHQLSVGKSRNDLKESRIASSIDTSQFVFREGSKFFHDQLFEVEKYNRPNITTNDVLSVVPSSSPQIVNLEISKLNTKFQENETLIFRSRNMISSLHLDSTFLQDSFLDNLILYSHQEYFLHVNYFKPSHVSNCMYHDSIVDWLEYSYLEKFPGNGKIIFILFRDQRGNFNTLILYPPDGENMERKENCQEDGALWFRSMVMSGLYNSHKLHNLNFSYFVTHIMTKLANGWRIHTTRMFKGMVRSCLPCF
jgi:hypothetical protein